LTVPDVVHPDSWVILKMSKDDKSHYRVLAGWSGGYLDGDYWKINSGIVSVEDVDECYVFRGKSSSRYHCHKKSYGMRNSISGIYAQLKDLHGDKVELLDEDHDWLNMDWIVK
tara:strand:- start:1928 stop:2266 length:339 start_codon:yes stop_codon:yes gene_type:complete